MENPFPTELPPSDSSTTPVPAEASLHAPPSPGPEASTLPEHPAEPPSVPEQPTESAHSSASVPHAALQENAHSLEPETALDAPPETSSETAEPEESAESAPQPGTLEDYVLRSRKGRLSPEEEAETARLLKEALLGGRAEVAKAVAATPQLPWVVTVQATAAVWPEIKPTFRAQFLAGLTRTAGEAAARVRLSLARGLFKVDPAASLKLILLTLKVLRDKETGLLEGKGASILANVLIGRGKAWILQLGLTDLKPAEVDLLAFAALHGAFHQPQAPITQLGILKWVAAAERLSKLPQPLEHLVLKGISRWSSKWQATLRRELSPLPDSWVEVLKSPTPAGKDRGENASRKNIPAEADNDSEETDATEEASDSRDLSLHSNDSALSEDASEDRAQDQDPEEADASPDAENDAPDAEPGTAGSAGRQKQRPVYVSKTVPASGNPATPQHSRRGAPQPFNLQDTLRQVEQYVASLRNELQATQKQLRQREDDHRRQKRVERPAPVANPGDLSLEEAIRLNHQLESRNAELQSRIDELTLDSEARAASRGLVTDAPLPDVNTELRTLLGFKLKEDFEDFQALEQEARDLVVQQHYRTVLRHVFEVLHGEGVRFETHEIPS